ncbi:hypothetical protein HZC09_03155 [Candidatus Micrarchaeota archaeon]|nr:hypothetical protein [Candidatus Micrarchaeota archaeon]
MVYKLFTLKESVRVPPNLFGMKLEKAALEILRDQYERTVSKDFGIIVSLHNASIHSAGRVLPGDGAAYFDVEFEALSFLPIVTPGADRRLGARLAGCKRLFQLRQETPVFGWKGVKEEHKEGGHSKGEDSDCLVEGHHPQQQDRAYHETRRARQERHEGHACRKRQKKEVSY